MTVSLRHRIGRLLGVCSLATLEALRRDHARALRDLEKRHAGELRQLRREHKAALDEVHRDRTREVAEARRRHERAGIVHRALLSPRVLKGVLRLRARRPPTDEHEAGAATARERRFLAASAAYRRAIDDESARMEGLEQVAIDGIPWWIPIDERAPERAERTAAQHFPYRIFLQTREWAVGGVMLDVGGNIGTTSIPRALLGDVRAVYTAEPEPGNYRALVQNVVAHRLRGLVLPDQVAIGATRGEVRLLTSRFTGGHRVLIGGDTRKGDAVQVPLWPLDEWLAHAGIEAGSVTFVKVDVQGSEVDVLRGAPALLARRQAAWQIEVDPGLLGRAGQSVADLMDLLEKHFTHFIDIGARERGPRVQSMRDLRDALSTVGPARGKTDLLLFTSDF